MTACSFLTGSDQQGCGARFMDLEEATRKATEYCGVGGEFTFEVRSTAKCNSNSSPQIIRAL